MSQSSRHIDVTRHDPACAALTGAACGCQPTTETIGYVRVCANCGGPLADRRRPYCSGSCRYDTRIRSKNLSARHLAEDIRAAEP